MEDMVTAQAEGPLRDPRITPIAHTIDAVAAKLPPGRRMEFYRSVGQAEEGEPLNATLRGWWMEAMFEAQPGREQRLADAAAGRGLVALPDEDA